MAKDESRTIRATLVEILHRMSLVPGEQRKAFANKETLLILLQFIYLDDHYEVQVRSFEALYFLTSGALNVEVWEEYSVVRQMIDAADARKKKADPTEHRTKEDSLWSVTLRAVAAIIGEERLMDQVTRADNRVLYHLY